MNTVRRDEMSSVIFVFIFYVSLILLLCICDKIDMKLYFVLLLFFRRIEKV